MTYLYIVGPLYIYRTVEDTDFKFGAYIDDKKSYPKFAKLVQMGRRSESRNLLLNCGPPLHCVSKNDTDVAQYNFNAHQSILVIFGRDDCILSKGDLLSHLS